MELAARGGLGVMDWRERLSLRNDRIDIGDFGIADGVLGWVKRPCSSTGPRG